MNKFDFDGMALAATYYDVQPSFFKGDGKELDFDEDIFAKGLSEDDYPFTIGEFEKMGYGFSKAVYECEEEQRKVIYEFNNNNDFISIESDDLTMKECFIIIDMINRQLLSEKAGLFVCFGNDEDDTHALYLEESSVFGMWWNNFIKMYQKRLKKRDRLSKVLIFREDYETDDERFYTKDRVVHIVLI